jgi:nitrilase
VFLDLTGAVFSGYVVDPTSGEKSEKEFLQKDEGTLYAELDLDRCIEGKQYHDVVGWYQRLDIFNLKVDRSRREPAKFIEQP